MSGAHKAAAQLVLGVGLVTFALIVGLPVMPVGNKDNENDGEIKETNEPVAPHSEEAAHSEEEAQDDCQICYAAPAEITCSVDTPHSFCASCFDQYAQSSFEFDGIYCREVTNGNGNTSYRGELPCPWFTSGCSCSDVPEHLLGIHLSDESYRQRNGADSRLAPSRDKHAPNELQNAASRQEEVGRDRLDHVREVVAQALSLGKTMKCPSPDCQYRSEKDDACMHMVCSQCECRWCYCCGRENRRNANGAYRCGSCETNGIFLQDKSGWGNFSLAGETRGCGATHEFHRRRMAYFVGRVASVVPQDLWQRLRQSQAALLHDVPTLGRNIDWDSIRDAEAPTFGRTTVDQLMWKDDAEPLVEELRQAFNRHELEETTFLKELLEHLLIQQRFSNGPTGNEDLIQELLGQEGNEDLRQQVAPNQTSRRKRLHNLFRRRRRFRHGGSSYAAL